MMKQLETPEHYYTARVARQLAAELQAGDHERTYTVVDCAASGWSWIVVQDADGHIVAEKL